jgi:DNA-binding transcriptional MerR regulator
MMVSQFAFLETRFKIILAILMQQLTGMNLKEIKQLIKLMKIGKLDSFLSDYILEMLPLMALLIKPLFHPGKSHFLRDKVLTK